MEMSFEVTVLPVTDPDRAKAFYQGLGWRLDADIPVDDAHRIVHAAWLDRFDSVRHGHLAHDAGLDPGSAAHRG